ncbi:MAG: element excision factor XisH family protein [Chloroflexota bacterium]
MAAKDIYHDHVKTALIQDGWTITHDHLRMTIGRKDIYIDLGAERLIAAERDKQKIAVEVKSFVGRSDVADLEKALGQFVLYEDVLNEQEPDRTLYLAIRQTVYHDLFEEPIGQILLKNKRVRLVIFNPETKEIVEWIK